ncbi:MAG: ABC-type proline/glycine betaine transport system substrate-binding protein, partial [Halocynthiibacter sp.]
MLKTTAASALALVLGAGLATAECGEVVFSDVGW